MIRVVAVITAKPGRREDVLALFRANLPAVHAEAGCIDYAPFVDAEGFDAVQTRQGPDTFVVLETWASAEALKDHGASPHMAAYGRAAKDMIAERKVYVYAAA